MEESTSAIANSIDEAWTARIIRKEPVALAIGTQRAAPRKCGITGSAATTQRCSIMNIETGPRGAAIGIYGGVIGSRCMKPTPGPAYYEEAYVRGMK